MKFFKSSVMSLLTAISALVSCTRTELPDNGEQDYGYVQFKLYKEASYEGTKALVPELEYLADAGKVRVTLSSENGQLLTQTLTLSAASDDAAEFGLRSTKLKLLAGNYQVISFLLYDKLDNELYKNTDIKIPLSVIPGGLSSCDLLVKVQERGKVRFRFVKDYSGFDGPQIKATGDTYTFDEIKYVNISVRKVGSGRDTEFTKLPVSFSINFDEEDRESDNFGYQTSSLKCDSLLSLPAGDYRVTSYTLLNKSKDQLERTDSPVLSEFTIRDNRITDADINISLHEDDAYIQDYYALYAIWKALDGKNWYYAGENFPKGSNWDFNKSIDLWGDQPGVSLHSNGRVAVLDLSDFGIRGNMPEEIGQLTELVEIYLGTHNDNNLLDFDPTLDDNGSSASLLERHRQYLYKIHPATQMSEPIALGLAENNITIRETELYQKYSESELIDPKSGRQYDIQPMDITHGKICNGLLSLPDEFCNLVNLEKINIANGLLTSLPANMGNLKKVTELEIYNCPKMETFPVQIADMPALQSVNISNNAQWSSEEVDKGFKALSDGACAAEIQILYARENNITCIPASASNMKKLHLLDLALNKIRDVAPFGRDVMLTDVYLDNNLIEALPQNFCGVELLETFSVKNNKLKLVPDIFNAKSKYILISVDFSYNEIEGFENDGAGYKGVNVATLSLVGNKIRKFPKCIADSKSKISYINMRACNLEEFEEDCFKGENMFYLTSLDLSYNRLSSLPKDMTAENMPYLYGIELSYNRFKSFPYTPLDCSGLTVFSIRGQRDASGGRCLKEWPANIGNHRGMRALFIGSNDLQKINDSISYLIYTLDISDNPNIVFDASNICYYWQRGVYDLRYDKTQTIIGCDAMLN